MKRALARELGKGLLLALPLALLLPFLLRALGSFSDHPWRVAAVLLPLAVAVALLGRPLWRDRRLLLGGGFLPFFVAWCLLFAIAAETGLLSGRRRPLAGYEEALPPDFLWLNTLGDWHYRVAPAAPEADDVVIVTLPSFEGRDVVEVRRSHAALVRLAIEERSRGIAFDYALTRPSAADRALCHWIGRAEEAGIPVLFAAPFEELDDGSLAPRPLPPELEICVAEERRGHVAGYLELDHRVRMMPLRLGGAGGAPALSLRVAELLAGAVEAPESGLLQFLDTVRPLRLLEGRPQGEEVRELRGRFVWVGSSRFQDVFSTPFGPLPGVAVHALAAQGLRSGVYVRRLDRRWSFPLIFAVCYLLAAIQAGAGGRRRLVASAALLSLVVVGSAALLMRVGAIWVEVGYPLAAMWGLVALLAGGAAVQRARRAPDSATPGAGAPELAAEPFDVFLSHNGSDKPVVRELGERLRERGLRVWLDEWELVPGRPWQAALEEVIRTVRSAAILVGPDGLGPWEEPEMRACLGQCVKRRMPVIPVLLPGAGDSPDLPLFLAENTWVDLRSGLADAGLDRLEWGITGIKPRRRRSARA